MFSNSNNDHHKESRKSTSGKGRKKGMTLSESDKLEIENKRMQERLDQLKEQMTKDKEKRSGVGEKAKETQHQLQRHGGIQTNENSLSNFIHQSKESRRSQSMTLESATKQMWRQEDALPESQEPLPPPPGTQREISKAAQSEEPPPFTLTSEPLHPHSDYSPIANTIKQCMKVTEAFPVYSSLTTQPQPASSSGKYSLSGQYIPPKVKQRPPPPERTENAIPQQSNSCFLDGEYDEEASRQSFQQALKEWRHAPKSSSSSSISITIPVHPVDPSIAEKGPHGKDRPKEPVAGGKALILTKPLQKKAAPSATTQTVPLSHTLQVTFNKGDFRGECLSYREKLLLTEYRKRFSTTEA